MKLSRLWLWFLFLGLSMTGVVLILIAPAMPDDLPSPFAGGFRQAHGAFALAGVFMLGFMVADHVRKKWKSPKRSMDGLAHFGLWFFLVLTGYWLYYPLPWFDLVKVHWLLGLALMAVLPAHILRRRLRGKLFKISWLRHLLVGADREVKASSRSVGEKSSPR